MTFFAFDFGGAGAVIADSLQIGSSTGPTIETSSTDPRLGLDRPINSLVFYSGDLWVKASALGGDSTFWMPLLAGGQGDLFGDGSDGDLSVTGTTTEAGGTDRMWANGTIGGSGIYETAGRPPRVLQEARVEPGSAPPGLPPGTVVARPLPGGAVPPGVTQREPRPPRPTDWRVQTFGGQ